MSIVFKENHTINTTIMQVIKTTKICSKCGIEKSLTDYPKDKSKPDGYYSRCKICKNKSKELSNIIATPIQNFQTEQDIPLVVQEETVQLEQDQTSSVDVKACNTCGILKPLTDYYRDASSKTGYTGQCKECKRIRKRKSALLNSTNIPVLQETIQTTIPTVLHEQIELHTLEPRNNEDITTELQDINRQTSETDTYKACTNCKIEKELSAQNFYRTKNSVSGYDNQCKVCRNTTKKQKALARKEQTLVVKTEEKKPINNVAKQCHCCYEFKSPSFFSLTSNNELSQICDSCIEYSEEAKKQGEAVYGITKKCRQCQQVKELSDFAKNTYNTSGISAICIQCENLQSSTTKNSFDDFPTIQIVASNRQPDYGKKLCTICGRQYRYSMSDPVVASKMCVVCRGDKSSKRELVVTIKNNSNNINSEIIQIIKQNSIYELANRHEGELRDIAQTLYDKYLYSRRY